MIQQFRNMEELTTYLTTLEGRVNALETENKRLLVDLADRDRRTGGSSLPRTNLVSPNFLTRAFAVWGHFFVVNLMISAVVTIIYLCLVFALLGPSFGNLLQQ